LYNALHWITDVTMRRRRVISLLSLAGLSALHGCADSSAPRPVVSQPARSAAVDSGVVVATHYESIPRFDLLLTETEYTPLYSRPVQTENLHRLPPTRSVPVAAPRPTQAPVTHNTATAFHPTQVPVTDSTFQRLPELNCVAAAEPRPYAIDLSAPEEPRRTAPNAPATASPLLPSIVKIVTEKQEVREPTVPQKRFVEAKAPKPPLTSLVKQVAAAPNGSAGWLSTGTSLASVSERADALVDHGFLLGEKGAYYSARTEFKQALRTVAQALDAHFEGNRYSESLAAGWLALEEAGDFSAHGQHGPVVNVALIVASHQTPLLKDYALDDVSPVLAMQHYFSFAQEQLVEACGRAPVAARALYGLGKVHMVLAEKSPSAERLHGPKALAFQQAALATDPSNYMAANELGVLLARFGKLHEARTVLQHAVAIYPAAETWRNLSVVHQRLGEEMFAAQSLANWQVALQQAGNSPSPRQADNRSMVQWVSPQTFAGEQASTPNVPSAPEPVMQDQPPAQAQKKSGFLWW